MAKKAKKAKKAKSAVKKTAKKTRKVAKKKKKISLDKIAGGLMPARHTSLRTICFSKQN